MSDALVRYAAPLYVDIKKTIITRQPDGEEEEIEETYPKTFLGEVGMLPARSETSCSLYSPCDPSCHVSTASHGCQRNSATTAICSSNSVLPNTACKQQALVSCRPSTRLTGKLIEGMPCKALPLHGHEVLIALASCRDVWCMASCRCPSCCGQSTVSWRSSLSRTSPRWGSAHWIRQACATSPSGLPACPLGSSRSAVHARPHPAKLDAGKGGAA